MDVIRHKKSHLIGIEEYRRPGWTYHAKGIDYFILYKTMGTFYKNNSNSLKCTRYYRSINNTKSISSSLWQRIVDISGKRVVAQPDHDWLFEFWVSIERTGSRGTSNRHHKTHILTQGDTSRKLNTCFSSSSQCCILLILEFYFGLLDRSSTLLANILRRSTHRLSSGKIVRFLISFDWPPQ